MHFPDVVGAGFLSKLYFANDFANTVEIFVNSKRISYIAINKGVHDSKKRKTTNPYKMATVSRAQNSNISVPSLLIFDQIIYLQTRFV